MKIGLWNVRGIGRKTLWTEIEAICKNDRIHMIALVETKTQTPPNKNVWKKAGFDTCLFSPANGRSGGICLLWKNHQLIDEMCEMVTINERFIAVKYKILSKNISLIIIFAYAPPNESSKDQFWSEISSFILNCHMPCILMGDLNEITNPTEKKGGVTPTNNKFIRLNNFINQCELVDLPTTGNTFT